MILASGRTRPIRGYTSPLILASSPEEQLRQPHRQLREDKYEEQPHPLQDHKRHHAPVNLREALGQALHAGRALEESGGHAPVMPPDEPANSSIDCRGERRINAPMLPPPIPRPAGQQGDGSKGRARVSRVRAEGESPWPARRYPYDAGDCHGRAGGGRGISPMEAVDAQPLPHLAVLAPIGRSTTRDRPTLLPCHIWNFCCCPRSAAERCCSAAC